jgi:LPS sulfotransferase NodH
MRATDSDLFFPQEQDLRKFERTRERKTPAQLRYVIWFTPRSGSSWLTDIARATDRLGNPGECFNPGFVPQMARKMHAADMDQYIQMLLRRRQTRGVFGCELTFYHLQRCFESTEAFMRYFDGAPAVWLLREDIVQQAVSLVKMQQTRIAHSVEADADARAAAERDFVYDAGQIEHFLDHVLRAEAGCEALFKAYGHAPLRLSYERNMAMGGHAVLNAIAHHIGLRPIPPQDIATGHVKLGTDRNAEFADRFRSENPDLIARVDAVRAPYLATLDTRLPDRLPPAYGGAARARKQPGQARF